MGRHLVLRDCPRGKLIPTTSRPATQTQSAKQNIHLQCIAPAVFGVRIRTVASPVDFANSSTFPKLRGS